MRILPSVIALALILTYLQANSQSTKATFRVLVLAENGGHHIAFTRAARPWLDSVATTHNFTVDYIENTERIDETFLKQYSVFLQLDYPPYGWPAHAERAFQQYMEEGHGGWIGLHHATLLGEFDGFKKWQWFSDFMGGIEFKNYIASFATGEVRIEDTQHPCMKDVSPSFFIEKEEWYTYDKSPRKNVRVLAHVDESTYKPNSEIKMGDHPVIWSNEKLTARNLYIFMGHSPDLLLNKNYTTLLRNAILWAADK